MPMLRFRESKHGEVFCGNLGFSALVPIRLYPCFVFPPLSSCWTTAELSPFALSPLHVRLSFEVLYIVLLSIFVSLSFKRVA
jgi:hypothetical protein